MKNQSIETTLNIREARIKARTDIETKTSTNINTNIIKTKTEKEAKADVEINLRMENEQLKQRLNAANNAIRDLEKVYKNSRVYKKEPSSSLSSSSTKKNKIFSKLLGRRKGDGLNPINSNCDDRSTLSVAASEASTVQMGSSKKCKLKRTSQQCRNKWNKENMRKERHARTSKENLYFKRQQANRNQRRTDLSKPKLMCLGSCSKNLILGPVLRQMNAIESATRTRNTAAYNLTTPPCTPERTRNDEDRPHPAKSLPVEDILSDIDEACMAKTLGIAKRVEKQKKPISLTQLSKMTNLSPTNRNRNRNCNRDHDQGVDVDGSYPVDLVDLQQANPIMDDEHNDEYDDSDEGEGDSSYASSSNDSDSSHLPIIYEYGSESERSEDSRVEI